MDYEEIMERHLEDIKVRIGPVCKNCGHVIAFSGLVHCAELDCTCLNPEPDMSEPKESERN